MIAAFVVPNKRKTNSERIRKMSDVELARWVVTDGRLFGTEYEGYLSLLDWLREEAADDVIDRSLEEIRP